MKQIISFLTIMLTGLSVSAGNNDVVGTISDIDVKPMEGASVRV